jgi:hypothetical protein
VGCKRMLDRGRPCFTDPDMEDASSSFHRPLSS